MQAIVAVDECWGIGKNGGLLVHNPADMRFFRQTTLGKVVVMGRRTLESFPGGRPLPKRANIVLTRREDYRPPEGAVAVRGRRALLEALGEVPPQDVFVIGGGEIYAELLPDCDRVLVTKMQGDFGADMFFPDLDALPGWVCRSEGEWQECEGVRFRFCTYVRA